MPRRHRSRLTHDRRVLLLALSALLPGTLVSLSLLWTGDYSLKVQWTLTTLVLTVGLGCALALRDRVVQPLHTISNLLAALREGDFSVRGREAASTDPLSEVMREVNALTETLHDQRLDALEATALLRKVMAEIDVAVFAFDSDDRLQLANRFGEQLLGHPATRLLGKTAAAIGLAPFLGVGASRIIPMSFPGGSGRWEVRSGSFRQHGLPHRLLVLTDVSKPLRDEERRAWQRLIRVLGHELNNSLAPIKSIAGSLASTLGRPRRQAEWQEDMMRGLAVIESRAESLSRFMTAYARLARLPPPQFRAIDVGPFVRRVVALETRLAVALEPGPDAELHADGDQLEQLLINLVRNAVDAAAETGGGVRVGWNRQNGKGPLLEIWVDDEGPGLASSANLFVPFFTTKPTGTGIGLVLSRQIAEAHDGTLTLQNRPDRGCRALLRLPL